MSMKLGMERELLRVLVVTTTELMLPDVRPIRFGGIHLH